MKHILNSTMQVNLPFGGTLLRAAVILVIMVGFTESLARASSVEKSLLPPIVSGDPEVGIKFYMLEQFSKEEVGFDCLVVGSSIPDTGIDPPVLSATYAIQTGKPLNCFNLSMTGLSTRAVTMVTSIAIRLYHPRLIIYGTSVRDFGQYAVGLDNTPWVQYQLGVGSPEGWLESNLMSYRYFVTYRAYLTEPSVKTSLELAAKLTRYGQLEYDDKITPLTQILAKGLSADPRKAVRLANRDIDVLARLFELRKSGTDIVVVAMPWPLQKMNGLPSGSADYQAYLTYVRFMSEAADVPFVMGDKALPLIPEDGWRDYAHLNPNGSEAFSRWLGEQLGLAVAQGRLADPSR